MPTPHVSCPYLPITILMETDSSVVRAHCCIWIQSFVFIFLDKKNIEDWKSHHNILPLYCITTNNGFGEREVSFFASHIESVLLIEGERQGARAGHLIRKKTDAVPKCPEVVSELA